MASKSVNKIFLWGGIDALLFKTDSCMLARSLFCVEQEEGLDALVAVITNATLQEMAECFVAKGRAGCMSP